MLIISYLAKLIHLVCKKFHLGSGYTFPGHIGLKINPHLLKRVNSLYPKGIILISGTNGKTTTSKLLTHVLEGSGLKVLHNKTGANLVNGIASAVLLDLNWLGRPTSDVGVFEVDEFTLPVVLSYLTPSYLILLNLSRDQLDRYGETDIILEKWLQAIAPLSRDTTLLLDTEQHEFSQITGIFKGRIFYFDSDPKYLSQTHLVGHFNAKNVNAAVITSSLLSVPNASVIESLGTFTAAYGRGEFISYKDLDFQMFLAKNPASFNNNLQLLLSEKFLNSALYFILNDNIPDGRDVSWIYDIDPLLLNKVCEGKKVFVSGTRYLDLSIRLKYAHVDLSDTFMSESDTLVLSKISDSHRQQLFSDVVVLPNYSAMLNLREILTGNKIL